MLVSHILGVTTGERGAGGKAARTRARLLAAALELFSEQGYDATTVTQIARRVGVTEMTFYRHFGSKEALVVSDPYDPLIAAAVAAQPVDLPPLVRAARGVRAAWEGQPLDDDGTLRVLVSTAGEHLGERPVLGHQSAARRIINRSS